MSRRRELPIWVGSGVRLTVTFTDPDTGQPEAVVEPVTITVKDPADATTTPTVEKVATGVYRADFQVGAAGIWHYRAASSGALPGVVEGDIDVEESEVV